MFRAVAAATAAVRAVPQLLQRPLLLTWRLPPAASDRSCRAISSSSRSNYIPSHAGTEAAPFRISPAAAVDMVRVWLRGVLPRASLNGASGHVRIVSSHAFYFPFWAFAVDSSARSSAAPSHPIYRTAADSPALLVYSGACLPRPMADVLKHEVAQDACEPFRASMLEIGAQVEQLCVCLGCCCFCCCCC
jgi:hypothetical protein